MPYYSPDERSGGMSSQPKAMQWRQAPAMALEPGVSYGAIIHTDKETSRSSCFRIRRLSL